MLNICKWNKKALNKENSACKKLVAEAIKKHGTDLNELAVLDSDYSGASTLTAGVSTALLLFATF